MIVPQNRKVLLLLETSREYGRSLLRGILRYSALHGPWQIEWQQPFYLTPPKSAKRLPADPLRAVDGIIMREQHDNTPYLNAGVPVIFAGYLKDDAADACRIATDDEAIGVCAADHFLERGLTQFAYLGYGTMYWSENRKNSFARAVAKQGFECRVFTPPKKQALDEWSRQQHAVAEWIRSLPKPVGLLACNDDRARQAVEACRLAQAAVPDDVAIVGVDDDEFVCNSALPPLSSVALNLEAAGFRAAERLDAMMKGDEKTLQKIIVEAIRVVPRQSSEILRIADPLVLDAVRFIRDNGRRPLQVEDVLGHVAVSRRTLYEKFTRVLGCSVHDYIKKIRVEQIETLLLETDWTIARIAQTLGFTSADHIAAYFRSKTGINPYTYRLKNKLK